MKNLATMILSTLAGVVVGAAGLSSLRAQTKPPTYFVAEVDVSDNAGFVKEYLPKAQASIKSSGGRFLVAGQNIKAFEGAPPRRVIVTAWESVGKVEEWFNSPAFKEIRTIGDKYAKFRLYTVEGLPQ
jgi:uncharacterized protein (DUF1330 family)